MTYPVALSLTHSIPIDHQIKEWYPGDGDPWHYLWAFWYFKRGLSTFPPHLFWTDLVFYPVGFEIPFLTGIGAILVPAALLVPLVGLILTYNLLWLLSFVLAGYGMYLLGRYLFQDRLIAAFCGYVFMFSSYRMMHALEHLPLVMPSFLIPLFALWLFKAVDEPTTKHWVFCALVLAASAGISWYCTVSLLIYLAIFALCFARRHWSRIRIQGHLGSLAVAMLVLAVTASPFVLPLLISPARDSIVTRQLTESSVYSADLLAFFMPGPRNPVFGRLVEPIYERLTGNPYEQTVYLGYILLALSVFGALRSAGDKARFFRVVAVIYFVLALGPFLHVAGRYQFPVGGEVVSIPLPYLLLHYIPYVDDVAFQLRKCLARPGGHGWLRTLGDPRSARDAAVESGADRRPAAGRDHRVGRRADPADQRARPASLFGDRRASRIVHGPGAPAGLAHHQVPLLPDHSRTAHARGSSGQAAGEIFDLSRRSPIDSPSPRSEAPSRAAGARLMPAGTLSALPRSSVSVTSSFTANTWIAPSSRSWTGSSRITLPTSGGGWMAASSCTR